MCGIAGLVTTNNAPVNEGLLRAMSNQLAHRGPDGEGLWLAPGVGLAHRRLAIIDISSAGAQPMACVSGRFHITFNGEIYNFKQLRSELEALGATFRTHSDTEVILEGYRLWQLDILKKLRGMFALAIWDEEKKELILARDKIGKKPLFITPTPDGLAFASEIKALAAIKKLQPAWDAVRLFLGLQYVPTPRTGFKDVMQLEPGSFGLWKNGDWKIQKYHGFDTSGESQVASEYDAKVTDLQLRSLLAESVKLRMLASDVPVGAFLSGGVDSAAVVAYASQHVDQLNTFTMGFDAPGMDERTEARELAAHFKTNHHEFLAKPADLLALIDELVGHYDAPYADSSALPLWLLAKQTSNSVKVVLTGDGGDELFGGYRRYIAFQRAQEIALWPGAAWIGHNMRRVGTWLHDADIVRMGRTIETVRANPSRAYGTLFCGAYFDNHDLKKYFKQEFLEQTQAQNAVDYISDFNGRGVCHTPCSTGISEGAWHAPLQRAMNFDLLSYLPDDLNVKMDRATMRFGLEARAPFLDQELVQFALGLPLKEKVNGVKTKLALKRALRGLVPDSALDRPKRGFQVPLAEWFRGPLAQLVADRVLDPAGPLAPMINLEAVQQLVAVNTAGADHGNRLWMLLALSSWLSRYGV